MSSIGPELPPHLLAKKKRKLEEEAAAKQSPEAQPHRSSSPDNAEKRRRVVGPAPPPAPLDELPPQPAARDDEESSSDSDDDYGPAPPTGDMPVTTNTSSFPDPAEDEANSSTKAQRDEWMMLPPEQDDLAARMDPSKLRARKFNTGKGARAPNPGGGGIGAMWTETPEQKRKRLENEVLGIAAPAAQAGAEPDRRKARSQAQDEETARRIKEHTEKVRGPSLVEQHRGSKNKEEDDDPSKRAFDWEKDMGSGAKIGHAQRNEMLKRASDFGSRFAGGSYL